MTNRQPIMLAAGLSAMVGTVMMFFPGQLLCLLLHCRVLLGAGSTTTFVLAMTLFGLKTKSAADTRNLSGMVQSISYLIAALGPVIVGN